MPGVTQLAATCQAHAGRTRGPPPSPDCPWCVRGPLRLRVGPDGPRRGAPRSLPHSLSLESLARWMGGCHGRRGGLGLPPSLPLHPSLARALPLSRTKVPDASPAPTQGGINPASSCLITTHRLAAGSVSPSLTMKSNALAHKDYTQVARGVAGGLRVWAGSLTALG